MSQAAGINSVTQDESIGQQEAAASIVCAHKGYSGASFSGIDLSGSAAIDCLTTYGFYPRICRFDAAGNFGFQTLDGNQHLIAVDAKSEFRSVFIKTIYPASYATAGLRSTSTIGLHIF
jgi:hypothetical protein